MNDIVYLCEEGCGEPVNQEGGTCLACWEIIDAVAAGTLHTVQS